MGWRVTETDAEAHRRLEGREAAFAEFVGASLDRSYALAAVILGNRVEAEDAVHDAALRAWSRWGNLRDPRCFDAWFGRILLNACRDRIRRRRPSLPLFTEQLPDASPDPFAKTGEIEALQEAIARLSVDHRTVIALRYLADLSLEEVADRLNIPMGTVKSRLHHAMNALRASYAAVERAPGNRSDG